MIGGFLPDSDSVLQFFTRFEFDAVRGLDMNRFSGLRILACAGFPVDFGKAAETGQGNLSVFFLQFGGNGAEK